MRSVTAAAHGASGVDLLLLTAALLMAVQPPARAQSVLQYHLSADRAGNYVVPGLTLQHARSIHLDSAFDGRVDGHLYAQPLLFKAAGREILVAATENNVVEALDAGTGKPVWRRSLGQPATSTMLQCGNIDPLGITGTPIIDNETRAIYLDAMVVTDDGPQHLIFGLSLENGQILRGFPVNVARSVAARGLQFVARDQNQRGALLIMHDTVYVPYGGHYGDCGNYHGWVVGVGLNSGHRVVAWSTQASGGGIWAPGGIVSDGHSLFAATGNTFETSEWGGGEAVIRLGFDLKPLQSGSDYFVPSDWRGLDRRDADLGGTSPLPINLNGSGTLSRLLIALGKDGKAYLLNRDNLGGIGGDLAAKEVSSNAIITAPAVFPAENGSTFVVFPARGFMCPAMAPSSSIGALEVRVRPAPAISVAWCAPFDGNGTPIVTTTDGRSNPIVWIVGAEDDDRLHAFRGDNGQSALAQPQVRLSGLRHFAPIVASEKHLFVAADDRIYAFTP
jgi:outer membrane protein assembly factor BamB